MRGTLEDYATAVKHVLAVNRDAEQGFRGAASAARDSELREAFEQYSLLHHRCANELQEAVKAFGFEPAYPSGVGGMIYAGWIELKAALDGHDSHSILVEAERCGEWCVNGYREALATNLPVGIRSVLAGQYEAVEAAHQEVLVRRDRMAEKASLPKTKG
ncbi:MAG TPA: PA2169 family four-helix-bundle protein [Bryobacteraceae bacterium]|jgi:uncharacterized protein (TIGR02284 family)